MSITVAPRAPSTQQPGVARKQYQCETCGGSFDTQFLLSSHQRAHIAQQGEYNQCTHCGKTFSSKSYLAIHEQNHMEVARTFSCETCGKTFNFKCQLTVHEKAHINVKPFSCGTCGKTFATKGQVKTHERTHLGQRPYQCHTCGKCYTVKYSLKVHERLHTGEKPYACQQCGKAFRDRSSLKFHEYCHDSVRKFMCTICTKRFVDHPHLMAHERTHIGVKLPFKCELCAMTFLNHEAVSLHVMMAHSNSSGGPERPLTNGSAADHEDLTRQLDQITGGDTGQYGQMVRAKTTASATSTTSESVSTPLQNGPLIEPQLYSALLSTRPSVISEVYTQQHSATPEQPTELIPIQVRPVIKQEPNFENGLSPAEPLAPGPMPVPAASAQPLSAVPMPVPTPPSLAPPTSFTTPMNVVIATIIPPLISQAGVPKRTQTRSRKSVYNCEYCGKQFFDKKRLITHMKMHKGEKPHQCAICGKCFPHIASLNYHQRIHNQEGPYKCEVCGKIFGEKINLTVHMRNHTGNRPYQCDACDKCFSHRSSLSRHQRLHRVGPYECEVCGKCFTQKPNLKSHQRLHDGNMHNVIQSTPVRTATIALAGPINTAAASYPHPADLQVLGTGGEHECNVCGEGFNLKRQLKNHQRIHLDEQFFECAICSEEFQKEMDLHEHEKIHEVSDESEEQMNADTFQNHSVQTSTVQSIAAAAVPDLFQPSMAELGSNLFQCRVCGKTFSSTSDLLIHSRLHTGEKLYHCDVCGQSFSHFLTLKFHKKAHSEGSTDQQLFGCQECGRSFSKLGELEKHLQLHMGGVSVPSFRCDSCGELYASQQELVSHLTTHPLRQRLKPQLSLIEFIEVKCPPPKLIPL